MVLGIGQDAGKPQLACTKSCCQNWDASKNGTAVSLALLDSNSRQWFLFEASPGVVEQLALIPPHYSRLPQGIFISHAHMGHYAGLLHFGREAANAQAIPLYSGPRFCSFITENGPWSQLIDLKNIQVHEMPSGGLGLEGSSIWIESLEVPHRDEFSETLGFIIKNRNSQLLFIPDIDKWEKWNIPLDSLIHEVDYALIDATFYDGDELPNRDMSEIPHPFVVESMALLQGMNAADKAKVHFIHLNHSNPLWDTTSKASQEVARKGFKVARPGQIFDLSR